MSIALTPMQTLIIWYLIGKGGAAWKKEMKPELKPRDQNALVRAKLISIEQRRDERTRRKSGWVEVTEPGWAWASEHLAGALSQKAPSAGRILQDWLTHLQVFLRRRGISLADFITEADQPRSKELETQTSIPLEDRIRHAYLDATGGIWKQRVRLAELRRRVGGVTKNTLDAALLKMQQASKLVLFRLDNKREITDEDREAAIMIGGEPRHVLHMEA
jgi:hypothetical protein